MEETFLDSVSRWLGYIALTWITYLIYLASGLSIADCVSAILNPKKTEAPHIQVIPATPNTPDKTFDNFELLNSVPAPEPTTTNTTTKRRQKSLVDELLDEKDEFVLEAPDRKTTTTTKNSDHPTDTVTSECTESAAEETACSAETSAMVAATARITSAATAELCDPMCDATTRFNVTRCSFSVEKLQTLPSIKILTPEDVCPPGTLISGLPESGNDDNSDSDPPRPPSTTTTTTTTTTPMSSTSPTNNNVDSIDNKNSTSSPCEPDERSTNLTDHHSPQRSNSDGDGTTQTGRRTGGDDLLVKMLCDIDQVDAYHDLRKPRPSIDEPLVVSEAEKLQLKHAQLGHSPRKHHKKQHKQVSWDLSSSSSSTAAEREVRFTLPESDTADCSDESRSEEDEVGRDEFHESPDSDDEGSEGSPTTQRKTPNTTQYHATSSPLIESLLKDLSDEALDESAARIDTGSVLDALLFQNRRRRSLPTVQEPGGDYEMVYREKLERQSLGDPDSILTEPSMTPQKFKASLREEDFADLLPPLSPDCGYDSLSEVVSSPDEFDCYGSAQQLSVIVEEDPFEEDRNLTKTSKTTQTPKTTETAVLTTQKVQNGNTVTEAPETVEAAIISTMNAKHEVVDGKTPSLANRNHFVAPTEDFDNFTTVRL